jgi:hypothetical protein
MRADPRDRFKPLPIDAQTLLDEGRLNDALKSVRQSHGLHLSQAREWVESHIAAHPLLRVQLEARQREWRRKFFLWFFVVDAVVAAGLIYYLFYMPR